MLTRIDKKDQLILNQLKQNSRNSTKNIAKNINTPRVTVHDRIKKLKQKGIIKKFTIKVDNKKIGLPTEAFIFVSFQSNTEISQRELAKKISRLHGVTEVHIISGEYDLLLKVVGESLEKIGNLVVDRLRKIKGVGRTLTFACFQTIKE